MVALLFVQVMVSRATVTVAGSNLSALVMLTLAEVGAAGPAVLAAAAGVLPLVGDAPDGAQEAANARSATQIPICKGSV